MPELPDITVYFRAALVRENQTLKRALTPSFSLDTEF